MVFHCSMEHIKLGHKKGVDPKAHPFNAHPNKKMGVDPKAHPLNTPLNRSYGVSTIWAGRVRGTLFSSASVDASQKKTVNK